MHMMKNNGERSLKSLNMKWLALLAAADVLFVLLFVAPDLLNGVTMTQIGVGRVLTTTMMPVVVLLFVNVLPPASTRYWGMLQELMSCKNRISTGILLAVLLLEPGHKNGQGHNLNDERSPRVRWPKCTD